MRPADGKCSYVFKGKNSPEVRGNPSSRTIARKWGEGKQLLGAAKHRAAVDGASTELVFISTQGELGTKDEDREWWGAWESPAET